MNEIRNFFEKLGADISKYYYKNGNKIINTNKGSYLVKKKYNNKKEVYDYLASRGFNNYQKLENNFDDSFEVYKLLDDSVSSNDKAIDLIYLISLLHTKTTTYQEVSLDKVKKVYEETIEKIEYLNAYYHRMQDYIESKVYMSPAESLLIRNMSNIYEMLSISRTNLEKWYEIKQQTKKERVAFLHNNLSLDSFIDRDASLLGDWDLSKKDWVIYDFYHLYRKHYLDLELNSLYDIYQSKYKYTEDEKMLFYALLSLVWKVDLKGSNYDNSINVSKLVTYIKKTKNFILKENEEDKKTNKKEFSQENNSI